MPYRKHYAHASSLRKGSRRDRPLRDRIASRAYGAPAALLDMRGVGLVTARAAPARPQRAGACRSLNTGLHACCTSR